MRPHVVLALTMLLLFVGSVSPLFAQETESVQPTQYFTVSGGWDWPVGGPMQDTYEAGPTLAASFRSALTGAFLVGLEAGYSWFSLDTAKLAELNPGSTFSDGDMGLLSITTEHDYLFNTTNNPFCPFLNTGIGYYKSFIDDAYSTTGSTVEPVETGVYKGSFFGFHLGIGALLNRDRFGLRLDANYVYLFAGGPDLEFFTARAGFIFYMSGPDA